ncbi:MarR family winged helix-turn-helix transcriptional regulator [Glutamicibacter endophyticus]|uniref:MarR family winged helix-turn-helix transcriptional regulator n=1 Tax=Glutamicibacter endophyticus TaxID=1522174 RepID=UPI003AF0C830
MTNPEEQQLGDDELLRLEQQVCFAAAVAARTIIASYKPVLDPLGLTHPQYLVMLALWEFGPIGARELAERLHLDPGTLSPLVKRLEAAGLLERNRNPRDERAIVISLTEQGTALRTQALNVPREMMRRLDLDEAEVVQLRTTLQKATRHALSATDQN